MGSSSLPSGASAQPAAAPAVLRPRPHQNHRSRRSSTTDGTASASPRLQESRHPPAAEAARSVNGCSGAAELGARAIRCSVDARSLFDGMPPGESKGEVLQHILGFLEAQESVRTCVLARRWHHLWKSATGLSVVAGEGKFLGSMEKLCDFVDSLLRHRGGSPLHTCKLWFSPREQRVSACLVYRLDDVVNTWFWHAVRCQVRVLSLKAYGTGLFVEEPSLNLDNRPIDSRHLTRLDLHSVIVNRRFLNFSNCPSLEHLKFQNCCFELENDSRAFTFVPQVCFH
ncbi:hypothetical protein C2845_PM05G01150 [Panicum miliaceum]|uniref:F-box domain-containing protein n=1 Tax=Panicum miliaceum TaxID=4540 RepID=A0A3L6T298_PANMI|nr:hypothetical protein C2845_PM05G01150 [Panicum miliaceum]